MSTPLEKWVEQQANLARPDRIYWCDGSEEEARRIMQIGMEQEKIEGRPVFYFISDIPHQRLRYGKSAFFKIRHQPP